MRDRRNTFVETAFLASWLRWSEERRVGWEVGEGGCGRACVCGEGGGEVLWSILLVASDEVSLEGDLVGQVGFGTGLSRAPSEDAGPVCDVRPRESMRSSARSSSASATPSGSPRTVLPSKMLELLSRFGGDLQDDEMCAAPREQRCSTTDAEKVKRCD